MNSVAGSLIKRLSALKALRQPHDSVWSECYDYTYPLRGSGLNDDNLTPQSAKSKVSKLLDSTSTECTRTLASTLISGITPANSLWFDLGYSGMTDDEKAWFSEAAKTIWENIHASNYDAEAFEACIDLVCAGWFVLYIDELEHGGYNFQQWPISEVYAGSTRKDGVVDTIFRCYQLTAEQAIAEFGDLVSDKIRKDAEKQPDTKHNDAGRQVDVASILSDSEFIVKERSPSADSLADINAVQARYLAEQFAQRSSRVAEYDANNSPTFNNGTAYLVNEATPYYDRFIQQLEPKIAAEVPDVLFSVGRVNDTISTELTKYLPGYHNGLRELRISGGIIKHIHDSRPTIARDMLSSLDERLLTEAEVLPNHQRPDRALLVLKAGGENGKTENKVTVLEIAANGKGIDVVTSMTSPSRSLKKARALKDEFETSRLEGQQLESSLSNSPHLPVSNDTRAAADFLHVNRDDKTISPLDKNATTEANNALAVDLRAAQQAIDNNPDLMVTIEDSAGVRYVRAVDLLAEAEKGISDAKHDAKLFDVAVACFLRG